MDKRGPAAGLRFATFFQLIGTMTEATDSAIKADQAVNGQPMIEAIGLSKFYGVFAACRDVSFTVNKGEVVAFLGPNGAGKSTTMKLLTGYLAPSQGTARIAGHDMSTDRLAGSSAAGLPAGKRPALSRHDAAFAARVLCRRPRHGPRLTRRSGSTR